MLDLKLIRTETEKVKKALARRKEVVDIDALLELDAVNVKATTEEKLGFTGNLEGISAHCVALID